MGKSLLDGEWRRTAQLLRVERQKTINRVTNRVNQSGSLFVDVFCFKYNVSYFQKWNSLNFPTYALPSTGNTNLTN
jgi:hypothetical protein